MSHALTNIEEAKMKILHLKKRIKRAQNNNQDLLKDYESAKRIVQDFTVLFYINIDIVNFF